MYYPERGRERDSFGYSISFSVLRNVLPRKGTRTNMQIGRKRTILRVKKCITPKGDENSTGISFNSDSIALRNVLPRKGTRTQVTRCPVQLPIFVKKCITPKGDENSRRIGSQFFLELRNVLPRKGTRTSISSLLIFMLVR